MCDLLKKKMQETVYQWFKQVLFKISSSSFLALPISQRVCPEQLLLLELQFFREKNLDYKDENRTTSQISEKRKELKKTNILFQVFQTILYQQVNA